MSKNTHSNLEYLALTEYVSAPYFRTILPELKKVPHGRTEICVTIELSKGSTFFHSVLPEIYSGTMYVYGYVRNNTRLEEVFARLKAEKNCHKQISLYDWKENFLLVFENIDNHSEKQYLVTVEDVWNLLRNCLHPNGM